MCSSVIFAVLLFGISSGFVLTSSTNENLQDDFFEKGKMWIYDYSTKVELNGKSGEDNTGFILKTIVSVESIWEVEDEKILKFSINTPKISLQSKEINFQSTNENFYILWKNGNIDKILLRKEEELQMVNLKKGIASLFQLKFKNEQLKEQDSSGLCDVTYKVDKNHIEKIKSNCENFDLSFTFNTEMILSTKINSTSSLKYRLKSNTIQNVYGEEYHEVFLQAKDEIGMKILIVQELKLLETKSSEILSLKSYDEVKQKLIDDFGVFKEDNLLTHKKDFSQKEAFSQISFSNLINEYKDNIKSKNLGKLTSAKVIIPLINSARRSNKDDILKVLNSKKNQKILPQIYDILGYVQTDYSHQAVMKNLHFDDSKNEDNIERYLWACQLSSNPNPAVVEDLLNKFKKTENIPKKIQESLILSIAAMTSKIANLNKVGSSKIIGMVRETILNHLDVADKDDRIMYLRALRNLKSPQTIAKLIEIIKNKKRGFKEEVLSWKALKSIINGSNVTKEILLTAYKCYFQIDKKHDSSSRTLAADILLETAFKSDTNDILESLLNYMQEEDAEFEVKKYVLQQIEMLTHDDVKFKERVLNLIKKNQKLNNYSGLSPKGLSLSLKRKFMESKSSNGSLLTIQEMSNGIVKRGVVDVVMDKNGVLQELASLGIFSGGLGSLMSSDSSENDDTPSTAGMELSILGTQIRPFVFFEGQGELMGHVWSGTASERTTAFQALILVQDHQEYLRLGSGFIVDIDFKGAASFDLAGKIEMSLWNRNAQALIEKSLGYIGILTTNLDTSFANLLIEYKLMVEPSLSLNADIDFSSNIALCLRLSQPESEFIHLIKKEISIGTKPISKKKQKKIKIPGKTYALNKKNDEKCSEMFLN